MIVFTTLEGSLLGIPASGGGTSGDDHRGSIARRDQPPLSFFLPDGVRFLYVRRNADVTRSGLYVGQIGSVEARLLLEGDLPAIYASPATCCFFEGHPHGSALRSERLTSRRSKPARSRISELPRGSTNLLGL